MSASDDTNRELVEVLRETVAELNGVDDLAETLRLAAEALLRASTAEDERGRQLRERVAVAAARLQDWQVADVRRKRARRRVFVLERVRRPARRVPPA